MKQNKPNSQVTASTYSLLVRSEEKERSLFEAIAYSLFILSAVAAIGQFALQPVAFPVNSVHTASAAPAQILVASR